MSRKPASTSKPASKSAKQPVGRPARKQSAAVRLRRDPVSPSNGVPLAATVPEPLPRVEDAPHPLVQLSPEPYVLQTDPIDPLDPGSILFGGLRAEMQRQLTVSREEACVLALDELLRRTVGAPRPSRLGRALVALSGPPGTTIPPRAPLAITGRIGKAHLRTRHGMQLGAIRECWGIGENGIAVKLLAAPGPDRTRSSPNDAEPLHSIWFGLHLSGPVPLGPIRRFPGLLWDLPAVLSLRVTRVQAVVGDGDDARIALRWARDDAGRLVVPPQEVRGAWPERPGPPGSRPACWLAVAIALKPGEWRHCGTTRLNVASALVGGAEPDRPIPPGTIQAPAALDALRAVIVEQPFAGRPGATNEDPVDAQRRLAAAFRHRGHAVTADDLADLLRDHWPSLRLLDVAPTRVRIGASYRDAVRLTVAPRQWHGTADLLAQSLLAADRAARSFGAKMPVGVQILVGPPSLRVVEHPAPDESLWPYGDYLHAGTLSTVCRQDGVFWPVLDPADLRGACS